MNPAPPVTSVFMRTPFPLEGCLVERPGSTLPPRRCRIDGRSARIWPPEHLAGRLGEALAPEYGPDGEGRRGQPDDDRRLPATGVPRAATPVRGAGGCAARAVRATEPRGVGVARRRALPRRGGRPGRDRARVRRRRDGRGWRPRPGPA